MSQLDKWLEGFLKAGSKIIMSENSDYSSFYQLTMLLDNN